MAKVAEKLEGLHCPCCKPVNTYTSQDVAHTERVSRDTATVTITVGISTNCGEQALDTAAARKIEEAINKLKSGALSDLVYVGEAYPYP